MDHRSAHTAQRGHSINWSITKQLAHIKLLGTPKYLIRIVFSGTSIFTMLLFVSLSISFFVYHHEYVLPRLLAFPPILLYLAITGIFVYRHRYTVAAWLLVGFYAIIATLTLLPWGINTPVGILAFGFVIILTGSILRARYIVPVTVVMIATLVGVQALSSLAIISPDTSTLSKPSTFGDVIVYGIIFAIFALIMWLSRRQMEQALHRALAAEAALAEEKRLLAVRLEEKTNHLRAMQIEEMQQLYRFAELGQLSTVVLHELANRLTVLTLDIDDIGQRHHQSEAVAHAKESISYLDTMVVQVRRQLHENNEFKEFAVPHIVNEVIATLHARATQLGVTIDINQRGKQAHHHVFGDPLRLSQILTILITNALDAYEAMEAPARTPTINVAVSYAAQAVRIAVTDHADGISEYHRSQLFTPFKTTKENGMGIGLFIARKMAETHFKGSLELDPRIDLTRFVIELPLYNHTQASHVKH